VTIGIAALVLFAAVLHASWNALLKKGEDGFWVMTVMGVATSVACVIALPFLPLPARASWFYIALSALLHVGYNAFLINAYRASDFGSAYPVARGSSPLLVTLGAAVTAGEMPSTRGVVGILLVSAGIISLAFRGKRLAESGVLAALGTGACIAAYSITDGIGGRLSGAPIAYTLWMCALWGATALPLYLWLGRGKLWREPQATALAGAGGIISVLAYGIVIFAMTKAPMGSVSALRETSVLFAVLLGRLVFGEMLTWRRMLSAAVIVAGAICLE
jgi:drug/metabolite transporter (DMT)-like permease